MDCDQIERDEIAEQYVAGRLPEAEQAEFEAHYFNCSRCLDRVGVLQAARTELSRTAMPRRSRNWWFRGAAAGLAAAAVIVLAVRVAQDPPGEPVGPTTGPSRSGDVTLAPPPAPTVPARPDLRALSEIQPPTYEPLRLRGNTTRALREFRDAMEQYAAGNYAAAIPGLQRATAADNSLVQAHFYLGISQLETDRPKEAIQSLQRAIALGESAYLEDAHFFLAKARLREDDVTAARVELNRVIALRGERRQEATQLLAQLDELRPR